MERKFKVLKKVLKRFSKLKFLEYYEVKVDYISKLPSEISSMILSMLDAESLASATQVSRKWRNMCRYQKKSRQVRKSKVIRTKHARKMYVARKHRVTTYTVRTIR